MGCCGKDEDHQKEGMVEDRKCRDVLFLLAFMAYWAGMFVVAGIAFREGDPRRLVYALDSRGLLCGTNNTYRAQGFDLTDKPNLYYLNPLDLLDASTLPFAKSICVAECPTEMQRCSLQSLPCTRETSYRCPYYRFAEDGVYGLLPSVNSTDTEYWGALSGATLTSCNASFLAAATAKLPALASLAGSTVCSATGAANGKYLQATSQFPGKGPCYPVWAATAPYFNRCFPKFPPELMGSVLSAVNKSAGVAASAAGSFASDYASAGGQLATYIADISKGLLIVAVAGLGAGIVLSLVWMIILRYFAGLMAWATIAVVNAGLAGCTLYCWYLSGKLSNAGQFGSIVASQFAGFAVQDPSLVSRQNWGYIAYAMTAVTGVVLLFTLVMLRRVAVAVACIKVASQAVAKMPSIMFFPLLPFVLEVGLVIYWVAVAATLYSAGVPTPHWRGADQFKPLGISQLALTNDSAPTMAPKPNVTGLSGDDLLDVCAASPDCYVSYDWDNRLKYAFIFHLFGLLWANQFIVGFASVVVAGAIGSYYWSRGDGSSMPTFPVVRAMRRTVIYNLGSIALGSFVIAIIQFVRLVLSYIDKKTRKIQQESKAAAWLMCLVRWMVWLLEKIVAFINRNAYIIVAVKGSNYCASAARGVQLVVANALRLATVNVVGDALLFLGKLAVAACCGLAAFGMANLRYYNDAAAYPSTYLSSAIFPIAVAVITGFVVAQIFFSVYEMAIDTTLLSFCEDSESHGGHPRFAPPLLMEAINEPYPQDSDGGKHWSRR